MQIFLPLLLVLNLNIVSFYFEDDYDSNSNKHVYKLDNINIDNDSCVIDYLDVLRFYYDIANPKNLQMYDFDTFIADFYNKTTDYDIIDFTYRTAEKIGTFEEVKEVFKDHEKGLLSNTKSSGLETGGGVTGGDALYVLTESTNYFETPTSAFIRKPVMYYLGYSNIQNGDIIVEKDTGLPLVEHSSVIVNVNKPSEEYGNYIQCIEAVFGGVQRSFLDDYRMVKYKVKLYRALGVNDSIVNRVHYFLNSQIGKPWHLDLSMVHTWIGSTDWYCNELVYASYIYGGINICLYYDEDGHPMSLPDICLASHIYNSVNTSEISASNINRFLKLQILSKSGNKWTIRVTNNTPHNCTIYYNRKMCFLNDAKTGQTYQISLQSSVIMMHILMLLFRRFFSLTQ